MWVAHTAIGSVIEHGTCVTAAERSAIIRPVSTLVTRFTDSSLKRTCLASSDPPGELVQAYKRENCSDQCKESNKGDDRQYRSSLEFRIDAIAQKIIESKDHTKNYDGNEESQHRNSLLPAR